MKRQELQREAAGDAGMQRAATERGLRLEKEYWLRTIQPHIAGRILRGVEFFVAQHAHWHLQEAVKKANDWNHSCDVAKDEARKPVSVDVDFSAEIFREPEVPEMLFADNVKPEILAAIAAPLVKETAKLTPAKAIRNAHELVMAAERYIGTLPKKKEGTESLIADFEMAFSTVTFAEIEASNRTDSGQLPLLPPVALKRKARDEQELAEKPLSNTAIKNAVSHFLYERTPRMSQGEYEREQEQTERLAKEEKLFRQGIVRPMSYQEWQQRNRAAIDDCLKNDRISLQDLCALRWKRFERQSEIRQSAALKRTRRGKRPSSAGSSATIAGKREK